MTTLPPAHAIARALGGEVIGRHRVLAPGPGHSARDRSLSVSISPTAPNGILVGSFAGDDWRACREHVLSRLGIREERRSIRWSPRPPKLPVQPAAGRNEDRGRIQCAVSIFDEAEDVRGTPAWAYLEGRGIDLGQLSDRIGEALRWHPTCPWESGRHGCMIGLYTDPLTSEARAIHRTAITPDGEKVGRKALGPKAGCVIRLWPADSSLVVGEGIETVLSAATHLTHRGNPLQPAWASGDAGNLEALPVIEGVKMLTLLVDRDESGRGQRAAEKTARQWKAAGRDVIRLIPREIGSDFNDVVKGLGS
jgi:putative DNA primase/helicase